MDLKEVAKIFIEAVITEVSSYELVIKDLRDRVARLETSGGVIHQESVPTEVIRKSQPSEVSSASTPKPSVKSSVKDRHLKFAVAIVKMLLKNQKEGKSPKTISAMLVSKFPAERVKLRATITILSELVLDQLVEAIEVKKNQNQYNVPESMVSTAREWVQAHSSTMSGDVPEGLVVETPGVSETSSFESKQLKSKKVVDPGPGAPVATLQRIHTVLTLVYLDGKYKSSTGHNSYDLKRSAWRKGYTVTELEEKKAEVTYLHTRGKRSRERASR